MKLQFLSAIARISIITAIITANIGVSSTAQTAKDIQPSSSLNRNKQNNLSLVGNWKAVVYKRGQVVNLFANFKPDGTYNITGQLGDRRLSDHGNWKYSNNILIETSNQYPTARSRIRWVSKNEFILTIISNGTPSDKGVQRTYYRDNSARNSNNQNEPWRWQHLTDFYDNNFF